MGPLRNANATTLLASAANSGSKVILRLGIGASQTRNHTHTNGWDAFRSLSSANRGIRDEEVIVAVGTTIADRPPHRSVQAHLRTQLRTKDVTVPCDETTPFIRRPSILKAALKPAK